MGEWLNLHVLGIARVLRSGGHEEAELENTGGIAVSFWKCRGVRGRMSAWPLGDGTSELGREKPKAVLCLNGSWVPSLRQIVPRMHLHSFRSLASDRWWRMSTRRQKLCRGVERGLGRPEVCPCAQGRRHLGQARGGRAGR